MALAKHGEGVFDEEDVDGDGLVNEFDEVGKIDEA